MKSKLSFAGLRIANELRLPQFKNGRGEPAHSEPDGSDWSPTDWIDSAHGELGEASNLLKKLRRGDVEESEIEEFIRTKVAWELADVVTYIDLTAKRLGIDLGAAIEEKFNIVSDRVGANVKFDDGNVIVNVRDEVEYNVSKNDDALIVSYHHEPKVDDAGMQQTLADITWDAIRKIERSEEFSVTRRSLATYDLRVDMIVRYGSDTNSLCKIVRRGLGNDWVVTRFDGRMDTQTLAGSGLFQCNAADLKIWTLYQNFLQKS